MSAWRLIIPTLLIAAAVGCTGAPAPTGATPTPNLSTATPGGSISVSLLNTPAPGAAADQGAQAISGGATPTAAAASLQTPTPQPGIGGQASIECPAPADPELPDEAPIFSRVDEIALAYLSEGGPPTLLEATLRTWGAIGEQGGLMRADRDFTAEGIPEVFLTAVDATDPEAFPLPGILLIFRCQGGGYNLLYQSRYALDRGAPQIISADDLTGDGISDVAYTVLRCQGAACFTDLNIIGWNPALETMDNLLAEEVQAPNAQVFVQDIEADGQPEVIVRAGTLDAPGAGPQREVARVYRWDGVFFAPAEQQSPPAIYRIHVLHDADAALRAAAYDEAISLYRQAIDDDELRSWSYPNESFYLRAYARFKLIVAYAADSQLEEGQAALDAFSAYYAPPAPGESPDENAPPITGEQAPGLAFLRMAEIFWDDFAVNRSVGRACAAVGGYVRANPTSLDVLNSFGTANPAYTAADVCPP